MRAVHDAFPAKASESLASIVGCDVETARRYFAGKRVPTGEALLAMLCSPVGPALLRSAVSGLPPEQRRDFAVGMMNL